MLNTQNSVSRIWAPRGLVVLCFILFAAIVRILPHPWNFSPVGALALFSGAKLGRSWKALLFPLGALSCGDVFVGFYKLMPIVYASFAVSVLIGMAIRDRQTWKPISLGTLLGASQFFVVTNLGMWTFGNFYPRTLSGLIACFSNAVPYFGNTLAGDAFYATLLFGGYALLERWNPSLRPSGVAQFGG